MIGLGTWKFTVKTTYYTGDFIVDILDDNGKYVFTPRFPGLDDVNFDYQILSATEKGDSVFVEATTNIIPGKRPIKAQFLFRGDICNVEADIPYIGKTQALCGQRI